ncbi:MAG TPA: hypothetical protein VFM54_09265 [Micromonosporaceae bacterium]|nr:hypothetical protein [Micromonosporaceae bacterium]
MSHVDLLVYPAPAHVTESPVTPVRDELDLTRAALIARTAGTVPGDITRDLLSGRRGDPDGWVTR